MVFFEFRVLCIFCFIKRFRLGNSKGIDALYWSLQSGLSSTPVCHFQDCSTSLSLPVKSFCTLAISGTLRTGTSRVS